MHAEGKDSIEKETLISRSKAKDGLNREKHRKYFHISGEEADLDKSEVSLSLGTGRQTQ